MNRDEAHDAIVNILSQYDFGGVYDYKRRDEANDILDAIWPDEHEHRWWSDSWGQWCQCGASILIDPNNPRPP